MARSTNEQNKTQNCNTRKASQKSYPEHHAENHKLHHRLWLWLRHQGQGRRQQKEVMLCPEKPDAY